MPAPVLASVQSDSNVALGQQSLQPILAAGTHYKGSPISPPSATSTAAQNASSPQPQWRFDYEPLIKVHKTVFREGRHVRCTPEGLVNRIVQTLSLKSTGQLPFLDKLQCLGAASREPRFAEAMLSGYFDVSHLVEMTRAETNQMIDYFKALPEGAFKNLVWTSQFNIRVCNRPLRRHYS